MSDVGREATAEAVGDSVKRQLFRYVTAEEWREYRAILAVFADTFFAELAPDEVNARLLIMDADVAMETVPDRLESLRRWGNRS